MYLFYTRKSFYIFFQKKFQNLFSLPISKTNFAFKAGDKDKHSFSNHNTFEQSFFEKVESVFLIT